MLTLNNTHFVTVETDFNRPHLKAVCLSAARFGIHIRVLPAIAGETNHGSTRADFVSLKMRTLLEKLDLPDEHYVCCIDGNDTLFVKPFDDFKSVAQPQLQEGKVLSAGRKNDFVFKGIDTVFMPEIKERIKKHFAGYKASCCFALAKWKDLKGLYRDIVYLSDMMKTGTLDLDEMEQRFGIQKDVSLPRTASYRDSFLFPIMNFVSVF